MLMVPKPLPIEQIKVPPTSIGMPQFGSGGGRRAGKGDKSGKGAPKK